MKTQALGVSSRRSTRLAYGCWRLVGTWDPREVSDDRIDQGRRACVEAYEAGYTLFDNADVYCRGVCESVLGMALKDAPGMREGVLIATKCGIRFPGDPSPNSPGRYDFSASHIVWSCEQSLKRLGIETIDLYQLHRPDVLMNPHEVAGAFEQLKSQGKVREFGVSNFSPSTLRALRKFCPMPLIVNQVEIHLGRLDCFTDGTLDQCIEENITPLAWSPLGGGWLAEGKISATDPALEHKTRLLQTLREVAGRYDAPHTVIAMAWLMKHPSGIIPIVGSNKPDRIREAVQADVIDLSREDWYRLLIAARGEPMP
jgi:predicted oxidoreductase